MLFTEVELLVVPDHTFVLSCPARDISHVCCLTSNYSTMLRCIMSPPGVRTLARGVLI
ncbi:hypothetical protein BHE74_00047048 [Ensete ventricosum]|nr:hypothetical protein BHE74_00047048 [Ensete ventricosum]